MHIVKSRHIIKLFSLLLVMICSSCGFTFYEFPDEDLSDEPQGDETRTVQFKFEFDTDWEIYAKSVALAPSRARSSDKMVRHTINLYSGHDIASTGVNTPDYTYTIINDIANDLNFSTEIEMPDGQYTCLVWSDYVYEDGSDLYYNTLDFHRLSYTSQSDYQANTDDRNGFYGKKEFRVSDTGNRVTVSLKSPLARYELLVSGLSEYLAEVLGIDEDAIDINDYSVTVNYSGFMPSKFNLFSGIVSDYWSELKYSCTPCYYHESSDGVNREDYDDEVLLASDYVFVNDEESEINLYIEVLDQADNRVWKSSVFAVPLLRSCDTIVRCSFISGSSSSTTTISSGGAVIDTEFSGEYNVII
jgi:hypothetical protein